MFTNVSASVRCSPMFASVFLLNIVYFSVCLTSNKLYWIDDQLADGELALARWSVGELTGYRTHNMQDKTAETHNMQDKTAETYKMYYSRLDTHQNK